MNDALFRAKCERFVSHLGVLVRGQIDTCREQHPDRTGPYLSLAVDHPSGTITLSASCLLSDPADQVLLISTLGDAMADVISERCQDTPDLLSYTWHKSRHAHE